mgnify:CR=1 FL=1
MHPLDTVSIANDQLGGRVSSLAEHGQLMADVANERLARSGVDRKRDGLKPERDMIGRDPVFDGIDGRAHYVALPGAAEFEQSLAGAVIEARGADEERAPDRPSSH